MGKRGINLNLNFFLLKSPFVGLTAAAEKKKRGGARKKCYQPLWQRQRKKGGTIHSNQEIWYTGFLFTVLKTFVEIVPILRAFLKNLFLKLFDAIHQRKIFVLLFYSFLSLLTAICGHL